LEADRVIVGFLGTIFSKRTIGSITYKVCNWSAWVVEKEYRAHSIRLLKEVMGLKGYLMTIFTAVPIASAIYVKLGFKTLDHDIIIFPPLPTFKTLKVAFGYRFIFDRDKIQNLLAEEHQTIFKDHVKFKCHHVLIMGEVGNCYLICRRVMRKGWPFVQIEYISDAELFLGVIDYLKICLAVHFKVLAVIIDERFIRNQPLGLVYKFRQSSSTPPKLFKFDGDSIAPESIDNLYSEILTLNLSGCE
jgi:hypothetical protein